MSQVPANPCVLRNPAAPVLRPSGAPELSPRREGRHRPRVLLEFPVRIRWLGPFGLETEITQTRNASRGGLLVSSMSPRQTDSLLWATFPYDAAVAFTESETPGKVVRCNAANPPAHEIAIAFHRDDAIATDETLPPNELSRRAGRNNRRSHARIPLAFLIRISRIVRASEYSSAALESPLWPEETMTVDVSPAGALFCTLRIYEVGEQLVIAAQAGRKLSGGERRARVVRIGRAGTDSPLTHVAVEFLS